MWDFLSAALLVALVTTGLGTFLFWLLGRTVIRWMERIWESRPSDDVIETLVEKRIEVRTASREMSDRSRKCSSPK